MTGSISNISGKVGLPPGALVHVGNIHDSQTRLTVTKYNALQLTHVLLDDTTTLASYKDTPELTWITVEGLCDTQLVGNIGKIFSIHPLVLEDILNTHQRPKFEEYDGYLYIVLKSVLPCQGRLTLEYEQISLLVLDSTVIVFKEKQDDLLKPIQQQLQNAQGRLRTSAGDYLTYSILDLIVDQYFNLIDALDDEVSLLEEEITGKPADNILQNIQRIKREMITIRRCVSPLRELLSGLLRSESPLIHERTRIYLRDVMDHAIHVMESIESYRDVLSGLMDIHISSLSNRMNEVMKVLTIFSTIFIPLTFLTGIYGMNFEWMPELHWHWSYPVMWIAFLAIPTTLLFFFKKRGWL
jgi:magnesium transporter